MVGINKAPIINDLESVLIRVLAEITPKAIGRGEMIAAIFQNPLLNADGSANAITTRVGSASNRIWLLLPGQESPVFYAEDQKDLYVEALTATNAGAILDASVLIDAGGNPGINYTVGDVLTVVGGNNDATIRVDTVSGVNGAILTFTILTEGTGYAVNTVYPLSGGTGTDAELFVLETPVASTSITILLYRQRKGGRQ